MDGSEIMSDLNDQINRLDEEIEGKLNEVKELKKLRRKLASTVKAIDGMAQGDQEGDE